MRGQAALAASGTSRRRRLVVYRVAVAEEEEEADWPYEKIETIGTEDPPSWTCPEEKCTCSEREDEAEPFKFSVMLCAPDGTRMKGARCRVVANGILANPDRPNADGSGWISVEIKHAPETVWVEWAPANTPIRPDLPYRRRYYVDLREDDFDEATRRRLYNLGFAHLDTLRQNVEDFQCEYDHPVITGEPADIYPQLRLFHDAALLPITKDKSGEDPHDPDPQRKDRGFQLAAFDGNNDPQSPGNNIPQPAP